MAFSAEDQIGSSGALQPFVCLGLKWSLCMSWVYVAENSHIEELSGAVGHKLAGSVQLVVPLVSRSYPIFINEFIPGQFQPGQNSIVAVRLADIAQRRYPAMQVALP
jgi:hypothetical protein